MAAESTPTYRFGDLVGLARQSWLSEVTSRLERLGYPGFRRGDSAVMRALVRGPQEGEQDVDGHVDGDAGQGEAS